MQWPYHMTSGEDPTSPSCKYIYMTSDEYLHPVLVKTCSCDIWWMSSSSTRTDLFMWRLVKIPHLSVVKACLYDNWWRSCISQLQTHIDVNICFMASAVNFAPRGVLKSHTQPHSTESPSKTLLYKDIHTKHQRVHLTAKVIMIRHCNCTDDDSTKQPRLRLEDLNKTVLQWPKI